MRWRIYRRADIERIERQAAEAKHAVASSLAAALKARAEADRKILEAGDLMRDLKLLRIHVEVARGGERVGFGFEVPHEAIWQGLRYGGVSVRDVLAMQMEKALFQTPGGRDILMGRRRNYTGEIDLIPGPPS